MKQLSVMGKFVQHKTEVISIEQEDLLWEKGILPTAAVRHHGLLQWLLLRSP